MTEATSSFPRTRQSARPDLRTLKKSIPVDPVPNPSPSHRRGNDTSAFVARRRSGSRHDPESSSHEFGDGRASTSVPFQRARPKTTHRTPVLANPFEHTRCSKSLHVSDRRNDQVRGGRSTSGFRCSGTQPRPLRQRALPFRASGQKDAPIDKHNTDHTHPKAGVNMCSSPSVGVRRHLPWGSLPFDGINDGDRYVPDYLPGTFRSQGFSPSQRFDPTDALWLCFTPHPSLGFRPSEPLPHSQPSHLSVRSALLSLLHRQHTNRSR